MNRGILLLCMFMLPVVLTAQTTRVAVELSDGSRVAGDTSLDRLKITTSYASLDLPLALFRTIEFGTDADRTARVGLQDGDQIRGRINATEIALKTSFGDVTIPMASVEKIEVTPGAQPGGKGKALPEGCVLHYAFHADEGAKASDSSGSGDDGTAQGASYVTEGRGAQGAMSFNGRGQVVRVKSVDKLKLQDFTIMAWIKRGSRTRATYYWPNAAFGSPQAMIFGFGQGGYSFGIQDDGTIFLQKAGSEGAFSPAKMTDDEFHHIAVTKKGKKITFYVDGAASADYDYDLNFEFNTAAAVGAFPDNLSGSFLGLLDELAVFNRPLSSDEVKGIYESQK